MVWREMLLLLRYFPALDPLSINVSYLPAGCILNHRDEAQGLGMRCLQDAVRSALLMQPSRLACKLQCIYARESTAPEPNISPRL